MFPVEVRLSSLDLENYLVLGDFIDVFIEKQL